MLKGVSVYCPMCDKVRAMLTTGDEFTALVHHIDEYHPEESPRCD